MNWGLVVDEMPRNIGVSCQIYCSWRKEYGGMRVDQARKLKKV